MEGWFHTLPSRLRAVSLPAHLAGVPSLIVRDGDQPRPFILWMHGRTADKSLDPGRYLRYVRRGINVCAVDLPGHGERLDERMHDSKYSLDVVLQMVSELDSVLGELRQMGGFDMTRAAIGGMSAGGMATIIRLISLIGFEPVGVTE